MYEDKVAQNQTKTAYTLPCQISCFAQASGAPEANTQGWPDQLNIQLLPRAMVMKMTTLKTDSVHVGLHFQDDSITPENKVGLEKMIRIMSNAQQPSQPSAGCVQFQVNPGGPGSQMRIMIIIYFEEKKAFYGFIPNEQEKFFNQLKQMVQEQKRQQMAQQMAQQQQNPGMRPGLMNRPPGQQPQQVMATGPQPMQIQQQAPPQMMGQTVNIRQTANPQFFQVK